jgi:hypothetical protein
MPAPARAELQQALSDLRLAAEALKTYDATVAERLGAAIAKHLATVKSAGDLSGEAVSHHARIVGHMEAIVGCLDRVKRYPDMMAGRADLLDRSAGLAKMTRLLLAKLAPASGSVPR